MPPKLDCNKLSKGKEKSTRRDETAALDELDEDDDEASDNDSTFSCVSCLQDANLALTAQLDEEKREKSAEETARKEAEQRAQKLAAALEAAKYNLAEEKRAKNKEKQHAITAEQRANKLADALSEEKHKTTEQTQARKAAEQHAKESAEVLAAEKRKTAKEEKDKKAATQRATEAEQRILELEERLEKANTKPDTKVVGMQCDSPESTPQMPEGVFNSSPPPENPTSSQEASNAQQPDEANTSGSSRKRKKKKPDPKNPGTSGQSSQNSATSPKEDAPTTKLDALEKIRNALPLQVGPAPMLPKPDAENLPSAAKKQKGKAKKNTANKDDDGDNDDAVLDSWLQKQNEEYSEVFKDLEACIGAGNYLNVVNKINKITQSDLPYDATLGETYLFFLLHIIYLASPKDSPSALTVWALAAECAFRKYLEEHSEQVGRAEYATLLLVSILYKMPLSTIETIINHDSAAMITPARANSESNCGIPIILACKLGYNWEWLLPKFIEAENLMQICVGLDLLNKYKEEKCITRSKSSPIADALQCICTQSIPEARALVNGISKVRLLITDPCIAKEDIKLCCDFTKMCTKWPSNFNGYELSATDLHSLAVSSAKEGMPMFAWECLNNALYESAGDGLNLDLLNDRRAIIKALCRNDVCNGVVKKILSPYAYAMMLKCESDAYPLSSSSSSSSDEPNEGEDPVEDLHSAIKASQNDKVTSILTESTDPLALVTETTGIDYALGTANNYGAEERLKTLLHDALDKVPASSSSGSASLESAGGTNDDETTPSASSSSSSSSSASNADQSAGTENSDDNGNLDCKTIINKDAYHLNAAFEWFSENFFSYEEDDQEQNQDSVNPIAAKIIENLDWIINRLKALGWSDDDPIIQSLDDKKERVHFDSLSAESITKTNALPELFAPEATINLNALIAKNSNAHLLPIADSGEILPSGGLLGNLRECSQEA